jgi:phosphoribosylformylglycinamidine synthase
MLSRATTKKRIFHVGVVISNKEGARDPEGETVLRDLVHRSGFADVKGIRAGKYLRVDVEAPSEAAAEGLVRKMCDDLRIYNPAAHSIVVEAGRLPE